MLSSLQNSRANLDQYFNENFVELKDPLNQYGRKIYVEKSTARFYDEIMASRNTDFNHLYIYKQIASLKGVGTLSSYLSTKTVLSRMLPLEGGQILYSVWHGRVYITEIRIQADYKTECRVPAGVYKVKKSSTDGKSWEAEGKGGDNVSLQASVNGDHLAINGHCKNIAHAADYMPKFIEHGHGRESLKNSYNLFFNPCHGLISGDWRALADSSGVGTTQASHKLAGVLVASSKQENGIYLTVHEAGHALFKEALRKVHREGASLENYTVYYANATHNLEKVDEWRQKTGMKISSKKPLINGYNARQSLLSGNIASLPVVAGRADPNNGVAAFVDGGYSALKPLALATGAVFSASWAVALLPYALGQGRSGNSEILDSEGKIVQHRVKQMKKLVWDPIHKMMARA